MAKSDRFNVHWFHGLLIIESKDCPAFQLSMPKAEANELWSKLAAAMVSAPTDENDDSVE